MPAIPVDQVVNVSGAGDFYSGNDYWDVARDPGTSGAGAGTAGTNAAGETVTTRDARNAFSTRRTMGSQDSDWRRGVRGSVTSLEKAAAQTPQGSRASCSSSPVNAGKDSRSGCGR